MPKLAEKAFSDVYLRTLKTADRRDHYDAVQRGLGVRVAPSGLKTWFVMRRVDGRQKRVTIGRYPEIGLAAARLEAARLLEDLAAGKAPKRIATPTFASVMEDWLDRDQKSKRSADEKKRALKLDVVPVFGSRAIDKITRSEVRTLLDRIVDRGAPIHANRVLAYLRRLFNWAVDREIIEKSPTAGIKPPVSERSRDRTLSAAELTAVWRAVVNMPEPFGPCFQMLIMTGQRRSEVAGMRWSEIDLNRGEWTIPAERAKNGKAHIVHLSKEAVDTLSAVHRLEGSDLVFTTTGTTPISGFSKAKTELDQASGVVGWTIHDLRRTFATIATGDLGIEPVVVDKILNHSSGVVTGVAAVYQRHAYLDQRRKAMETWGEWITKLSVKE
jgi:integrase